MSKKNTQTKIVKGKEKMGMKKKIIGGKNSRKNRKKWWRKKRKIVKEKKKQWHTNKVRNGWNLKNRSTEGNKGKICGENIKTKW